MNIDRIEEMSPGGTCSPVVKLLPAVPLTFSLASYNEGDGIIVGQLNYSVGSLVEIHAVRDTIDFEEAMVNIGGVEMFRQTIRMVVSRPTFDRLNSLHQITASPWICIVESNLGEQKMIGRKSGGATARFSTAQKTERIERNEAIVEFVTTQPRPAPVLEIPI